MINSGGRDAVLRTECITDCEGDYNPDITGPGVCNCTYYDESNGSFIEHQKYGYFCHKDFEPGSLEYEVWNSSGYDYYRRDRS